MTPSDKTGLNILTKSERNIKLFRLLFPVDNFPQNVRILNLDPLPFVGFPDLLHQIYDFPDDCDPELILY